MIPKDEEETREMLVGLQERDFAFQFDVGDTTYWTWRFFWRGKHPNTVLLTMPKDKAKGNMTIVMFFDGKPTVETVRAWVLANVLTN